ncbi:replication protein [Pseudomonas typographi]|uniref:Replication protein n=1 Tax=Pseudomonas typographi TaxID=2715964 RepID=A0ABR7Z9E7_9PSED|nr:replication protein [Pseudomonas typographi]MBD1601956.1 replication protein [Pseudomonas typographi]
MITNIFQIDKSRGFTRMDNDLYEALIGAELSGRELRVALAIHRLTAGFNQDSVKVAALYVAKMMYTEEGRPEAERANVSRAINSLIRQRVLYRDGGSRDPISFMPPAEWKIDQKSTVLKYTHCVENIPATVLKITHIKDRNTNTTPNGVDVAADATTPAEPTPDASSPEPTDKIPYEQIRSLYNTILGGKLPRRMGLNESDRKRIRGTYNLKLEGQFVVREKGLEFWEGLFNDALNSNFLLGLNNRSWKADFEFLTRASAIQRFLEGKYDAA